MNKQHINTSGLIIKERKLLIIKRSMNDDFLPGYFEIPGGKLEFGEEPTLGVIREVKEEVGLDINPQNLLYIRTYPHNPTEHTLEIFYHCTINDPNQEVTLSEEHSEHQWISIDEIDRVYMSDWMRECIKTSYSNLRKIANE